MNPYITYPLIILVVIGSFNYLYEFESATSVDLSSEGLIEQNVTGSVFENETETTVSAGTHTLTLDFNMTIGLVAIIVTAIALGLIGFNLLGSGLPDASIKILWNGLIYYGLWTIFSILAFNPITSIPLFGTLLWFFLTLFYSLGVFGKMGSDS